jgi:hypothetical protein
MPDGRSAVTDRFIKALEETERTRDASKLAGLFTPSAELHSYTRDQRGRDAKAFWKEYLEAFDDVRSRFTRVEEKDGSAVLEWESEGHLPGGTPIHYEGVTLLEFDGNQVKRFRTYYDSAAFLPQGSKHEGEEGSADTGHALKDRASR